MSVSQLSKVIERLFFLLLAGSCTFMVSYLHDINSALQGMQDRVGSACEQISAMEATLETIQADMKNQRELIDYLHPRKG